MGYRHRIDAAYVEDFDLDDGMRVRVRTVRPDDKAFFVQGFAALSAESRHRRCLTAKSALTKQDLKFLTEFDGHEHYALGCVLLNDQGHELEGLAGARYVRFADDASVAEMAITVVDNWQHRGIGKMLLEQLCEAAAARGVERFRCYILRENTDMRRLIEHVAEEYQYEADGSLLAVEFAVNAPTLSSRGKGLKSYAGSMPETWRCNPGEIARLAATGLLVTPATFACIAPALWWQGANAWLRGTDTEKPST